MRMSELVIVRRDPPRLLLARMDRQSRSSSSTRRFDVRPSSVDVKWSSPRGTRSLAFAFRAPLPLLLCTPFSSRTASNGRSSYRCVRHNSSRRAWARVLCCLVGTGSVSGSLSGALARDCLWEWLVRVDRVESDVAVMRSECVRRIDERAAGTGDRSRRLWVLTIEAPRGCCFCGAVTPWPAPCRWRRCRRCRRWGMHGWMAGREATRRRKENRRPCAVPRSARRGTSARVMRRALERCTHRSHSSVTTGAPRSLRSCLVLVPVYFMIFSHVPRAALPSLHCHSRGWCSPLVPFSWM